MMLPSAQYEEMFARTFDVPHAFAFWKGRVAFYAILQALGLGEGAEVIVPGFTCVVVPNAVRQAGARPVYADIQPETYNLDPASVERLITPRTGALLVQHTFGIPAEMEPLLALAHRYRLALIEDCAHALGSTYAGRSVGTFGVAAFYSSQWSKPYTTGLGGMAVTADAALADRLRDVQKSYALPPRLRAGQLRLQYLLYQRLFTPRLYWLAMSVLQRLSRWQLFVGSSGIEELQDPLSADSPWTMSAWQARAGLTQLANIAPRQLHRQRLTHFYDTYLQERGWPGMLRHAQAEATLLRYPIRVANKWELLRRAEEARIEMGSWFESVLHPVQMSLERFGYGQGACPRAEQVAQDVVNLPLHARVSLTEAERIAAFLCRHATPCATGFRRATMSSPQTTGRD